MHLRVADWLHRMTHGGPCEDAPKRCLDKPQPDRTWDEYDVSTFCNSCAAYWHASNAAHALERRLHAVEVDYEERKALTETPDALEKCVHCHEQYCDSYEDGQSDQPVHAACCKPRTREKGRAS